MPLQPAETIPRSNFPESRVAFPRYNQLSYYTDETFLWLAQTAEAGTKVGPDKLGPPVRVGSTRINSGLACIAAGPRTRLNHLCSPFVDALYRRFRASAMQATRANSDRIKK